MSHEYSLTVNGAAFAAALKPIKRLVRMKPSDRAVLTYSGQELLIDFPGGQVSIDAAGTWPEKVHLTLSVILGWGKFYSKSDTIEMFISNGRIHMGSSSAGCTVFDTLASQITLPLNAVLWELVAVKMAHTAEEIQASGLASRVEAAEERAINLVDKAAQTLAPLGVTVNDVRTLVVDVIKRLSNQ